MNSLISFAIDYSGSPWYRWFGALPF